MRSFLGFKLAVLALLACNAAVFARSGTPNEALDSAAWFALLVLFELETRFGCQMRRFGAAALVRGIRLVAALAILVSAIGYVRDGEWLDAANAWLWIAVVVLLEAEVRRPQAVATHAGVFALTAIALYGGLALVAAIWAWRGEWFDAYDALLWLVAFAIIELDLLRREKPEPQNSAESPAEVGDKA